ncbi:MAG: hypothetical protein GTO63_14025, partial [Anaerolineae bacterium]|nr:hypothetical protein [Anaerolineae bacterium]
MEDGEVVDEESKPLTDLDPGEGGLVSKITEEKRDTLRHLAKLGLTPGAFVEIEERAPFDGPLAIRVSGRHRTLDRNLAIHIHVKPSRPHGGG